MRYVHAWGFLGLAIASAATALADGKLPPFPADDPSQWVCEDSPPEPSAQQIKAWCAAHPDRGEPAKINAPPATLADLDAKNSWDIALRGFLREKAYRDLGWFADKQWRLTGPFVGEFGDGGGSWGVHPAVRIWYSPEVTDWLCNGRQGAIPDGAMIIKEMQPIDPDTLGFEADAQCMTISNAGPVTSWTVMVKHSQFSKDGWYWANPTASGEGNPPIFSASAVTDEAFYGDSPDAPDRNPHWYPTGDLFADQSKPDAKLADIVTPYSEFGAYCINCHASAESESTFSTLNNVLTAGLQFRHFAPPADKSQAGQRKVVAGSQHLGPDPAALAEIKATVKKLSEGHFSQPLPQPAEGFAEFFGELGPEDFSDAFAYRLPAEIFDHHMAGASEPGKFLTSDQCIGCHDATESNASKPNMLITDPDTGASINASIYAEWRASPMGLAGRDPIFFSQLQSETNHLPMHAECIENTCLHCHGVMGQRQYASDTGPDSEQCKELFAVTPPEGVPFGEPFGLHDVMAWQGENAKYGALARDGISCAVCHRVADEALGTEASYTGNWVSGPQDALYGPYQTVVTKPMEHALGITPQYGKQIQNSDMCGSCHNILLPTFNNDGTLAKHTAPDGSTVTSTYEQTTHLEWQNSEFARGDTFQSCQDCHMPTHYKGKDLAGTRIANIESDEFAPVANRLPDADIALTPRDHYARHALHGLNLFLNEMFQQFPLLLGVRQIDYMGALDNQPALITSAQSMLRMALRETAALSIKRLQVDHSSGKVVATVRVDNKVGHALPSGVGFRRVFLEFQAMDVDGQPLWASGRSNDLGVIVDGLSNDPLPSEQGVDQTDFQPHYQVITAGDQVQIYQELIKDSAGELTTAFLRRVDPVKDNRLRPRGYDPKFFLKNASPFIQILGELEGATKQDPFYSDPTLTGADEIDYVFSLEPSVLARLDHVQVRLYNQSIPPYYLQERFRDATVGPAENDQIKRLYYMSSHLNTGKDSPIAGWKLLLAEAKESVRAEHAAARTAAREEEIRALW